MLTFNVLIFLCKNTSYNFNLFIALNTVEYLKSRHWNIISNILFNNGPIEILFTVFLTLFFTCRNKNGSLKYTYTYILQIESWNQCNGFDSHF